MPGQLGKVLTVTRSASLAAALDNVRKGSYDAAVQQQGTTLVVHYSIAYQTMAAALTLISLRVFRWDDV